MTRTVLCGYGRFGRVYAKRAADAGIDILGVVELGAVHDQVREDGFRPFDSLREAIDVTHPALVIVATTEERLADLAVEALSRYVDVMLAKPGALSRDEADRITTTASRVGRRVVVDYTPTNSPGFRRLASTPFRDGILTVRMIRRGVAAYRTCGVLWDLAPHDIALALDLDSTDTVRDIDAHGWYHPDLEEPVGAYIFLGHQSGRSTRIEVDWMSATSERRVEVVEFERMHVWDETTDAVGWTRRGYRIGEKGGVTGIWDLDVIPSAFPSATDNVTRALVRAADRATDDAERFLEVTRIIEAAERILDSRLEFAA